MWNRQVKGTVVSPEIKVLFQLIRHSHHRVPTPIHPSSTQGEAGRNHLNEEITPLLPIGLGEQYSQTISNLGHAALMRRCELPYKRKCWTNSRGPLVNSVLWGSHMEGDFIKLCQQRMSADTRGLHRDVVYLGWLIEPSNMSPNAGGGGCWTVEGSYGAQINFGDLTPYLTLT